MRLAAIILLLIALLVNVPVVADATAKVTTANPNIHVKAYKGVYQGQQCLIIELKDKQVPMNAPSSRLRLLSDENNSYKSYGLRQIDPGKFVTTDNIIIDNSYFKLKVLGCTSINDIEINFKEK